LLIGCDTLVFLDQIAFGKAHDETEAAQMLKQLSGKTHSVISGLCVQTKQHKITETVISKVRFKTFSEAEIDYYIQKYQPFDKAGAYGIQEWLGYIGVESIEGSFYNIMGLPTAALWKILEKITIP
jgi:septum formation protein